MRFHRQLRVVCELTGSRELAIVLESRYNEIAGAPDYVGGSGLYITVYSCNPDFTEGIFIINGVAGSFNPSLDPHVGVKNRFE